MKHPVNIFLVIVLAYFTLTSSNCNKTQNPITGGGKGGNAILTVIPEAHGTFLDSCKVYIKYGILDAPANGVYDDSIANVTMLDTIPTATFRNLKVGLYHIYGVGYHTGYAQPNVEGGVPYTISVEDSQSAYLPTYSY